METSLAVKIQYLVGELTRRCEDIERYIVTTNDASKEYHGRLGAYKEVLDFVENLFEDVIYKDENS